MNIFKNTLSKALIPAIVSLLSVSCVVTPKHRSPGVIVSPHTQRVIYTPRHLPRVIPKPRVIYKPRVYHKPVRHRAAIHKPSRAVIVKPTKKVVVQKHKTMRHNSHNKGWARLR